MAAKSSMESAALPGSMQIGEQGKAIIAFIGRVAMAGRHVVMENGGVDNDRIHDTLPADSPPTVVHESAAPRLHQHSTAKACLAQRTLCDL